MVSDHIAKDYDQELAELNKAVIAMGGLAESQVADAIQAVVRRDSELAARVIAADVRADEMEAAVERQSIRLLALRQPVARDLREVFAALKISSDLERVCDYAANVAKRSIALNQGPVASPVYAIPRMAKLAQKQIKNVLDSYVERDSEVARRVWLDDEELDEVYTGLFRELLTYMMEDPRSITPGTHLLFMAKNIERIGDHATNIAETVYYLIHGVGMGEQRPKRDRSSSSVVLPGPQGVVALPEPDDAP